MTSVPGESISPLLDQFDAKTVDDIYLRALAGEYMSILANGGVSRTELSKKYESKMGIGFTNSFHLWFNDRESDSNLVDWSYKVHNVRHESRPEIQGLLFIEEEHPELFQSIGRLTTEIGILGDAALAAEGELDAEEVKELYVQSIVTEWKRGLAMSEVIELLHELLKEQGISEEEVPNLLENLFT